MNCGTLLRFWRTARWLRPVQIWGRLWFRLYRPRPDLRAAPSRRAMAGRWLDCTRAGSMTGPARFRFLSIERELDGPGDWNRADWPRLWLYNLHYFDDLAADDAASRAAWHRALIGRWIAENPPGQGNGWQPYPTSLRIVNWVKWALAGNGISPDALNSLATQARWLRRRLEIHLLGNHLWANAKALVFAGTFFEEPEADGWREAGLRLLRRELAEQILRDGGHFERSPMYHAVVLGDVLDLLQLSWRYPGQFDPSDAALWGDAAIRMRRWLRVMSHPDGDIAFFNDAALGIAPNFAALAAYADVLGLPPDDAPLDDLEVLPDSGYLRLQRGPAAMIADVGAIGPDHLPGHAHADTLSFELSLHGRRVLVNGGTSGYEPGHERMRQRGTAAHNTVVVDGQDSSEVWSSFRVARRARVFDVQWGKEGASLRLEAAHDGYWCLPGRVIHRRSWRLSADRLQITDVLQGRWKSAVSCWHVHPESRIRENGHDILLVDGLGRTMTLSAAGDGAELTADTWHPEFGVSLPSTSLRIPISDPRSCVTITW